MLPNSKEQGEEKIIADLFEDEEGEIIDRGEVFSSFGVNFVVFFILLGTIVGGLLLFSHLKP